MRLKTFTKTVFCCALFAASALTAKAADRLLIVGEAVWGGWSIDNSTVMLQSGDNADVFSATVHLDANKEFKFLTETDWGKLEYRAGVSAVTLEPGVVGRLVSSEESDTDSKFQVTESANYEVVCDLTDKTIVVTKAAYQSKSLRHTALWLIGSATPGGWSIGQGLILKQDADAPVKYAARVELMAGELKIAVNNQTGFSQTFYLRDTSDDNKMVFGGDDNKWNIPEAGTYDVTVDVDAMTISIVKAELTGISAAVSADEGRPETFYTLAGVRVGKPRSGGVYVKSQRGKAVKVLVK
ncbi:MAG: SusF/SusE family outer membrane protein [Prevotella sp.]|nr:SusF/SusE family outer membrane protein [Prevotella sp.]